MVDWAYVNGFGEEGGDPDLEHHDPMGHCGAQMFGKGAGREPRDTRVKCNRCGASATWHHTGVRWALLGDDGKLHTCKPSADEFEDLTQE